MKVIAYSVNGECHQVIPANGFTAEQVVKDVPEGVPYKLVETANNPSRVLRGAWKLNNSAVDLDIDKGKEIAHEIRRDKRTEAMKENLELIQKDAAGIPLAPGENVATAKQANAAYKSDIDDVMQEAIDAASDESGLLSALGL